MRQKIVAGNWKMHCTVAETEALLKGLLEGKSQNDRATVVVCPPFTSLEAACNLLKGSHIRVGGQDMSEHPKGAFTGEVSAEMLLTLGVSFVILGHSERRQYHAESDNLINRKAKAALSAGLTPIICIGETLTEREAGQTEQVVGTQIDGVLAGFGAVELGKLVLAYEPVWAIGTGRTATPAMAQAVHRFIRERVSGINQDAAAKLPILYGGSVKADNARGLFEQPDIDGGLVGGASLKADEFIGIINAA
ncbi:MAG: triose-phosphate isomerase [candidate division Zixibacteria bacterium]|nr:triose-phosphate isomerase [candidate division Zixibacteria bacterium]